jgi:hypothetical protein
MSFKGSLSVPGWESTAGEKHRRARLSDEQVDEIRDSLAKPEEIALKYGVTAGYVILIKRGVARRKKK